ncbi:MAG TPA: hypothetical protein VHW60_22095 [Caulobacteraceae bacterium]|jgi:hypothetical protein|nr:hypothetical protein [Caulobacteraceae bacterium]
MNKFLRALNERFGGDWGSFSDFGYFYRKPAGRIVAGFVLERTPYSRYIWRFALPICGRPYVPGLSFSDRISAEGPGKFDPSRVADIVAPFVDEALQYSDPATFVHRFPDRLAHPVVRREFAAVLASLSLFDRAQAELEHSLAQTGWPKAEGQDEDTRVLLRAVLTRSPAAVAKLLDEWEALSKAKFGIV